MSKTVILNDGVTIEHSSRKSNRSGYTGAALSPAWTLDPSRPFVAACSNPRDPTIMSQLRAQARTAWHGGCYSDAREAAYVVGQFRRDPVATETLLDQNGGTWSDFPADLYQLPVYCTAEQARHTLSQIAPKKARAANPKQVVDLASALRAVGAALKGVPKNATLIRESIEAQLPWFRNVDDAVSLALELVRK